MYVHRAFNQSVSLLRRVVYFSWYIGRSSSSTASCVANDLGLVCRSSARSLFATLTLPVDVVVFPFLNMGRFGFPPRLVVSVEKYNLLQQRQNCITVTVISLSLARRTASKWEHKW